MNQFQSRPSSKRVDIPHVYHRLAGFCAVRRGRRLLTSTAVAAVLFSLQLLTVPVASACGGFFCQNAPIDQAGEQIVFRQEGSNITAMVRILYTGAAEEFSWVVPVPPSIEGSGLGVGSDTAFNQLDFQTRPQFILEQRGAGCFSEFGTTGGGGDTGVLASPAAESDTDDGGVSVEDVVVGPYDAQILASDNPTELATWLVDNGYDLTDRGEELIAPYVDAGMKFVALKLRNGSTSGNIAPLIMRYQSEKPMIPIRLTAIAAEDDMGVLVYIVADARAVPENYLHVIPNYTRLNWYTGSFNAYSSYQGLITEAMDEAGGQGFATDYAGPITGGIAAALPNSEDLTQQLQQLDGIGNDADFLATVFSNSFIFGLTQDSLLPVYQAALPPSDGFSDEGYFNQFAMTAVFSEQQLADARIAVRAFIVSDVIEPVSNSLALLPVGAYLTRLYTTLSADEMTLDPVFAYNTAMPEQGVNREAVLDLACGDNGTEWTLTLGAGTGRDGEVVIQAGGEVPFAAPDAVTTQRSVFQVQETSATAAPVITTQNDFDVLGIDANGAVTTVAGSGGSTTAIDDDDDGLLGSTTLWSALFLTLLLVWKRRFTV